MTGWETSERVLESGGFESRQRVLVPEPVVEASEAGARTLGVSYWQAVDRVSRGGLRVSWTGGGARAAELVRDAGGDLAELRQGGHLLQTRLEAADGREIGEESEKAKELVRLVAQRHGGQSDGRPLVFDLHAGQRRALVDGAAEVAANTGSGTESSIVRPASEASCGMRRISRPA